MIQYIDKSALVAELEKRIKETESMQPKFDQFWAGQISAFKGVLKILDTFEVKEVDLNTAVERYVEQHKSELNGYFDLRRIAKHFYELGLKHRKESGYDTRENK